MATTRRGDAHLSVLVQRRRGLQSLRWRDAQRFDEAFLVAPALRPDEAFRATEGALDDDAAAGLRLAAFFTPAGRFLAALAGRPGARLDVAGCVASSTVALAAPDLTEAMAFWAARLVV